MSLLTELEDCVSGGIYKDVAPTALALAGHQAESRANNDGVMKWVGQGVMAALFLLFYGCQSVS